MGSVLCKAWLIGPSGVLASLVQNAVGQQFTVERPTREHQSRRWLNARVELAVLEYFLWRCPYYAVEED